MLTPLPEDVRAALAAGKKIDAIRLLRTRTGLGLAQAKALAEEARRAAALKNGQSGQSGQSGGGLSPGEVPRSTLSPGLVALVVVLAVAAWFLLGGVQG